MKTLILSYSYTDNNDNLASKLAEDIGADHVRITEQKKRTDLTIFMDLIFNRKPKINMPVDQIEAYDLVVFTGPVWIGQVATPLRTCFDQLKSRINRYAFVSICGGADGPDSNNKIPVELKNRMGKEPEFVLEYQIASLLPAEPKPTRDMTSHYHVNEKEIKSIIQSIKVTLDKIPATSF